jgi:hypothetical protein
MKTEISENEVTQSKNIFFSVPFEDMGDATFSNKMESKFLIRWIVETDKVEL